MIRFLRLLTRLDEVIGAPYFIEPRGEEHEHVVFNPRNEGLIALLRVFVGVLLEVIGVNVEAKAINDEHLMEGLVFILFREPVEKTLLPIMIGCFDGQLLQSEPEGKRVVFEPHTPLVAQVDVFDRDLDIIQDLDDLLVPVAL